MRECVRDVFAIYDNNISPGLLMIIIKIIILYFIQIRHTDDFPPQRVPLLVLLINRWHHLSCIITLEGCRVGGSTYPQAQLQFTKQYRNSTNDATHRRARGARTMVSPQFLVIYSPINLRCYVLLGVSDH